MASGGPAAGGGDVQGELARLREDLANAGERLGAIERHAAAAAGASSPAPASGGPPATGSVTAASPGGTVAGAGAATSDEIASLRRELTALQNRVDRLEGGRPAAR